jgi:hypothetical protein
MDYGIAASRGAKQMGDAVNSVFEPGSGDAYTPANADRDHEKIRELMKHGGLNSQLPQQPLPSAAPAATPPPQMFADGGTVTAPEAPELPPEPEDHMEAPNGMAIHFPDHAAMLSAAQMRVSQYLNTQRPQDNPDKLPYDASPSQAEQERQYTKAVALAANPVTVLNHVKDGSLTPETMDHFKAMYPDIHETLAKQLTQKITNNQIAGTSPSYAKRQALSLFLGTPLDSTLTAGNIMAAQATYANQAQQPAPGTPQTKSKRNTSKLGEASAQYQTIEQARLSRQQKQSQEITGK